jgi:two-component system cell cycle sensor histidine kinase PleC
MTTREERRNEIRFELLRSVLQIYRAAPFLITVIAAAFALSLESAYSATVTWSWWLILAVLQGEYALWQNRFFARGHDAADVDCVTSLCTIRFWTTNLLWVGIVPLFWQPDSSLQNLALLCVMIIQVMAAAMISFASRPLFLASTIPPVIAGTLTAVASGAPLFVAAGSSFVLFYAFLVHIGRQNRIKAEEALALRFHNTDLIRDLAAERDVSESARLSSEQANVEIRRREEYFRALVENAFDAIIVTDALGIISYASPSMRRMGYLPDDLLGHPVFEAIKTAQENEIRQKLAMLDESNPHIGRMEASAKGAEGEDHWLEVSVTKLSNDHLTGFIVNLHDITERKRTENELRTQFRVLEALAAGEPLADIMGLLARGAQEVNPHSRAALFMLDADLKVTEFSAPSFPDEYRKSGSHLWNSRTNHEMVVAVMRGERIIVTDCMDEDYPPETLAVNQLYNIHSTWLQPIMSRMGYPLGVFIMYFAEKREPAAWETDYLLSAAHLAAIAIERRRAEQDLMRATETAEMASRAKSKFLANMSHELRTPLNAIIGFSEIMREGLFGPLGSARYTEYAKDIHSSGTHLLSVIDDILDISKIEAGRYTLEDQNMNLADVLDWSLEMVRPRLLEKNLTTRVSLPRELPVLRADIRAMRQILLNLLTNALKFTPDGGSIDIAVKLLPRGYLEIAIKDTGIGIPHSKLKEVLEPFGQVDDPIARQNGGTGLGLPITKHLIEMHEGTFHLDSVLGKGTEATIVLPASRLHWPIAEDKTARKL